MTSLKRCYYLLDIWLCKSLCFPLCLGPWEAYRTNFLTIHSNYTGWTQMIYVSRWNFTLVLGVFWIYFIFEYSWSAMLLVSVVQKSDSVAHTRVSIPFQNLFPFRLLHNIEQSSLHLLRTVVCTCWSQTAWLSSPTLFPISNCNFVLLLPIFLFLFNCVCVYMF